MRWFFSFYALLNFLEHCSWISSVSFFFQWVFWFSRARFRKFFTTGTWRFFLFDARRKGPTIITFQYPIRQRQLQFPSRFRVTKSIEVPHINDHRKRLETLESGRPGMKEIRQMFCSCAARCHASFLCLVIFYGRFSEETG